MGFFKKSKIGFLNPKESKNGFCVSLLDRSIQDLSDYGASKEPKKSLQTGFFGSFGDDLICLTKKVKIHIPGLFGI